jgi:hypothetical protein
MTRTGGIHEVATTVPMLDKCSPMDVPSRACCNALGAARATLMLLYIGFFLCCTTCTPCTSCTPCMLVAPGAMGWIASRMVINPPASLQSMALLVALCGAAQTGAGSHSPDQATSAHAPPPCIHTARKRCTQWQPLRRSSGAPPPAQPPQEHPRSAINTKWHSVHSCPAAGRPLRQTLRSAYVHASSLGPPIRYLRRPPWQRQLIGPVSSDHQEMKICAPTALLQQQLPQQLPAGAAGAARTRPWRRLWRRSCRG